MIAAWDFCYSYTLHLQIHAYVTWTFVVCGVICKEWFYRTKFICVMSCTVILRYKKTCAPTSKERHILDLICIKILTGCHLENCLFQSTYNDFSLNAFAYIICKIFKQLLSLPQCSPLLHRDADTILLPLGIVYIKIFHDVL